MLMTLVLAFTLLTPPVIAVEAKPDAPKSTPVTAAIGEVVRLKGAGRWELTPNSDSADIVVTPTGVAFVASKPGVYNLICFSDAKEPAAWATISVGGVVPVPPKPDVPVVTLETQIKAAYAANKDASKKADSVALSAFYSASVGQKYAQDPTIATAGDLIAKIKVTAVLDATKLVECRKLIGAELAKIVPTAATVLTADNRVKIVALFAEIERILDSL